MISISSITIAKLGQSTWYSFKICVQISACDSRFWFFFFNTSLSSVNSAEVRCFQRQTTLTANYVFFRHILLPPKKAWPKKNTRLNLSRFVLSDRRFWIFLTKLDFKSIQVIIVICNYFILGTVKHTAIYNLTKQVEGKKKDASNLKRFVIILASVSWEAFIWFNFVFWRLFIIRTCMWLFLSLLLIELWMIIVLCNQSEILIYVKRILSTVKSFLFRNLKGRILRWG